MRRNREIEVGAVAPCDFPIIESLKAEMKVPRDDELPYLPDAFTVMMTRGTGPVSLDINMKRGVWVTGRVVDPVTGKPVRA